MQRSEMVARRTKRHAALTRNECDGLRWLVKAELDKKKLWSKTTTREMRTKRIYDRTFCCSLAHLTAQNRLFRRSSIECTPDCCHMGCDRDDVKQHLTSDSCRACTCSINVYQVVNERLQPWPKKRQTCDQLQQECVLTLQTTSQYWYKRVPLQWNEAQNYNWHS